MSDIIRTVPRAGQICKNVTVSGRRTSVRMEPAMWEALHEICEREGRHLNDLFTLVDRRRGHAGLTASIRVFIITYFREAAMRGARAVCTGMETPKQTPYDPPAGPRNRTPSPLVLAALNACGPANALVGAE